MDNKKQTEINIEGLRSKLLKQTEQHKNAPKRIKVGIEGDAKTGKTGLAMDLTKKTFYLDVDNGSVPTWQTNHDSTDRIIVFNPAEYDEDGEFMPYQTQGNIRSFIALAKQTAKTEEIVFVWDGVDTWLDYCTLYMAGMETSRMRPMKTAKQQDWFHRNQPFKEVMKEMEALDCDQIYITHTKPPFRDEPPTAIWNRWDSHLWTVLQTNQRNTQKGMEYFVTVKSSKYNPSLRGKRVSFLTVNRDGNVNWTGFKELKEGTL